MATRITPADRSTSVGQNSDMERSIAVSAETVGSVGLYSSVVTTAPPRNREEEARKARERARERFAS